MSKLHPAFDWPEVARLALASRIMDEMEENELMPQGLVTYQFSARGHELGQLLISQLLDRPHDAASVYYRSRPFMFGSGLTLVEAMASGIVVVGTATGGAAEILANDENALTFAPDDPIGLAAQVARLVELPQLRRRLAASAQCTAVQKFDIHRMTSEIEIVLETAAKAAPAIYGDTSRTTVRAIVRDPT